MTLDSVVSQTGLRQQARHSLASAVAYVSAVNLFLARRRVMALILAGLLLLLFAIEVGFASLIYNSIQSAAQTLQNCPAGSTTCQPATPRETAALNAALKLYGGFLTFPTSLGMAGGFAGFIGALLVAILAGTVVGSEYGFGTLRMSLARGLGRGTIIAGQVIGLTVLSLVTSVIMLGAGALVGVTVGPAFGLSLGTVTGEGVREIVVYGLAVALNVLLYALIALFFATLGRSSAAGIGGALGVLFLEFLANFVFALIGGTLTGDVGEKIKHVPDWFPGNNVGALATQASYAPIPLNQQSTLDVTHAALVSAAYAVLLIGGSYLLFRTRDMTD
jgi:ABC-type transport system involved in multi-copper enzyme maturation permease subunit